MRRPTSRSSAGWGFLSLKKLGLATILIRSLPVDVAPRDILLPLARESRTSPSEMGPENLANSGLLAIHYDRIEPNADLESSAGGLARQPYGRQAKSAGSF